MMETKADLVALGAVPKFREFWHSLAKEEQCVLYDIMVALRGPDIPSHTVEDDQHIFAVKMATTAKIRALFLDLREDEIQGAGGRLESSQAEAGGYYINRQVEALSDEDEKKLHQDLKAVPGHFLNHAKAALQHFFGIYKTEDDYLRDVYEILCCR
jgi:hypothetical protein